MDEIDKDDFQKLLPIKGSERIQINNILTAVCIGALSLFLFFEDKISPWSVGQLAMAVPLLVTSSLAYSKVCYRIGEHRIWDPLGWFTHSIGYIMIINAMTLLIYRSNYHSVAWLFTAVVIFLFLVYSAMDVIAKKKRLFEKIVKLLFYLFLLFVGSMLPIILNLI
ncbi:MAG: hypothetical protein NT039_01150 [Candidatus Berkelbacteria bacterium]|nr:hypothetical protein [Candidatus Berkelbacteria bacterium]